jgi:hypothetical protein
LATFIIHSSMALLNMSNGFFIIRYTDTGHDYQLPNYELHLQSSWLLALFEMLKPFVHHSSTHDLVSVSSADYVISLWECLAKLYTRSVHSPFRFHHSVLSSENNNNRLDSWLSHPLYQRSPTGGPRENFGGPWRNLDIICNFYVYYTVSLYYHIISNKQQQILH